MTYFNLGFFVSLITAFIASGSFAVIFQTNKRHLLKVCIAGLLSYFVFYTVKFFIGPLFLAAFISTFAVSLYGEISARTSHAPALIFIVAGLIPTVPGGDSYYSMKYLIMGDSQNALKYLGNTGATAIGIALGIVCCSVIFGIINDRLRQKKLKAKKTD